MLDKRQSQDALHSVCPPASGSHSVWYPYLNQDIRAIERVQRRATKMVPELKYLNYTERLGKLGLTTLDATRQRGDLIQYFKFVNHISWYHPSSLTNSLTASGPASSTRAHNQRLAGQLTKNRPTRSNYFTNRFSNKLEKTMAIEHVLSNEPGQ